MGTLWNVSFPFFHFVILEGKVCQQVQPTRVAMVLLVICPLSRSALFVTHTSLVQLKVCTNLVRALYRIFASGLTTLWAIPRKNTICNFGFVWSCPLDNSSTIHFDNPSFSRHPVYDPWQKQPDPLDPDTLIALNAQVCDCSAYLKYQISKAWMRQVLALSKLYPCIGSTVKNSKMRHGKLNFQSPLQGGDRSTIEQFQGG